MEGKEVVQPLPSLAWRIWTTDGSRAKIDDPTLRFEIEPFLCDGIILEDDHGIYFPDEISLCYSAAQYVIQTEGPLLISTPMACFERLKEIFRKEIGKEERVSGHILAQLHNSGQIDAYSWGRRAIEAEIDVFDVLHVMEGAICHFTEGRPDSILRFFVGHYEKVKNDLAGGLVYPKLQDWFSRYPDAAHEVKRLYEEQPDEKGHGVYACALHGLILNDFSNAFELLVVASDSQIEWISRSAINVMGLADYGNPSNRAALDRVIQICSKIIRTPGHLLIGTATQTLCRLISFDEQEIVRLLDEAGKTAEPEALYALSSFLWREEKTFEEKEWFWPMVLRLTSTKAEHKGTLANLDMLLDGWLKDPEKGRHALEFINAWISKQPSDVFRQDGVDVFFSSTMHHIAKHTTMLNRVITEWLLEDNPRYPTIAHKLIARQEPEGAAHSLGFNPAIIDELSKKEIKFLLRRILGYVFGEVQIHLVFSLVRTQNAEARTFGLVESVLRDQVGYDYPYQTIEYLKVQQNSESEPREIKSLCRQIITDLQAGLDTFDAIPNLKEFQPSSLKMRRFAIERRRQMNETMEEASKKSIFYQIVTRIPLKAGLRSFQTVNGIYTDPMELKSMSHSIAIPRSEIADPAGAAQARMLFRNANRDTP